MLATAELEMLQKNCFPKCFPVCMHTHHLLQGSKFHFWATKNVEHWSFSKHLAYEGNICFPVCIPRNKTGKHCFCNNYGSLFEGGSLKLTNSSWLGCNQVATLFMKFLETFRRKCLKAGISFTHVPVNWLPSVIISVFFFLYDSQIILTMIDTQIKFVPRCISKTR